MSQAFYRKWRPQTWDQVVAQDHIVTTLRNAVRTGRTGHAYLLAGPRGTGKTTTARLLAKALNCQDPDPANRPCDQCAFCQAVNAGRFLDLIEIDAASNTSVDDMRDLRDKIGFSPTQGQYKVYIIDEVHMLSTAAFNALLKTLEEPPAHAVFVLATTEIHKIPATILSRCQRYEFRRIPVEAIKRHLRNMADQEGLQVDDEALTLIARQATGAMRDAISLLDQLSSTGQRVTLAEAQTVLGTATSALVIELVDALLDQDAAAGLETIQRALDAGTDARQFARQIVDYLRNLLLVSLGNADQVDATAELRQKMAGHAARFVTGALLEAIRQFNSAAVDTRSAWHPGLALELALTATVMPAPILAPAAPAARDSNPPSSSVGRDSIPTSSPPVGRDSIPTSSSSVGRDSIPTSSPPAGRASIPTSSPPVGRDSIPTSSPSNIPEDAPPERGAQTRQTDMHADDPSTSPSAASPTIHDVQKNWEKVRQLVKKKNPFTEAALNSRRSMFLKEDVLTLGFFNETLKSKMEAPENLALLQQALRSVLGSPLQVRCVITGDAGTLPDDADIDGDGMVSTALNLGGKIIHKE